MRHAVCAIGNNYMYFNPKSSVLYTYLTLRDVIIFSFVITAAYYLYAILTTTHTLDIYTKLFLLNAVGHIARNSFACTVKASPQRDDDRRRRTTKHINKSAYICICICLLCAKVNSNVVWRCTLDDL